MSDNPFPVEPITRSHSDMINKRRKRVSELRLKNIPVAEIHEILPTEGIYNLQTGYPFTIQTVYADINWIDEQLNAETIKDAAIHRARQIAEIREVKRRAMDHKDHIKGGKLLLDAIHLEAKLLGTFAPTKIDVRMLTILVEKLEERGINPTEFIETTVKQLESA